MRVTRGTGHHRWRSSPDRARGRGPAGERPPFSPTGYCENVCTRCGLVRRYFDGNLTPWHLADLGAQILETLDGRLSWSPPQKVWTTYNPACEP